MIDRAYCLAMARYNAWQNRQLRTAFRALGEDALARDRGAFFGSILATANHLLWGDAIWMSRFAGTAPPPGGIADSVTLAPSLGEWEIARFRLDAEILLWAERIGSLDLTGELEWYSGATGRRQTRPLALCVTHMFNHQTHHRGQIHAMLSAAGARPPVSDLAFMPEEGPWL